jgi:hypothetical protein
MKKKLLILLILYTAVALVLGTAAAARAGEIEVLVEKLVEKGILSPAEGDKILRETKEEVTKQTKEGKFSPVLPEWVQKTKLTGDFRLRYQWNDKDKEEERHRGRFRVRLGIETQVADDIKFMFGLASGTGDPRSTNQTFGGSNEKKDINIDYAAIEYAPKRCLNNKEIGIKLTGGKFRNPLFTVSQLIWDSDITPEGGAGEFSYNFTNNFGLFTNVGVMVLEENSKDSSDPFMWVIQPGFDWKINYATNLKWTAGYYSIDNVEGGELKYSSGSNTRVKNKTTGKDVYKYDFDAFTSTFQLGFKEPFGLVRYASLFGEYVNNPDPSDNNQAFLVGFNFGHEKVKEFKEWQFILDYRRLERDSVLDILPDSDFYEGSTNAKGPHSSFVYGLKKNVNFSLNYFYGEQIHGPARPEHVMQTDLNFKF